MRMTFFFCFAQRFDRERTSATYLQTQSGEMISDQFAKQLVPQVTIGELERWDASCASSCTRTLSIPFDSRTEFAISSALDVVSGLWMGPAFGQLTEDEAPRADEDTTPDRRQQVPASSTLTATCTHNIRMLVSLLQVRPVIPNSLFAIIFQAIVTIGKVSPPAVLLAEHGPLLTNLLLLSAHVPTSIANVARVTARNVSRRVSPLMFSAAYFDAALLGWIDEHIASLASSPDAMTRLHNDRKIAIMLVDKMCRVDGDEPVGLELEHPVRSVLNELDPAEKQVATSFLARVAQHQRSPGPRVQVPWVAGGDTLGSPLPQLPDGAAIRDRMRDTLLTSDSTSRSQSSGIPMHSLDSEAKIDAVPIDVLRRYLLELEHDYHAEMDKYRKALDDERHRRGVLEARLRFVQDEGEEIERESRSQSRAAISYLTPRAGHGSGKAGGLISSPLTAAAKLQGSPPHERVVDLLVRQCAIHDSLSEATSSAQHVAPTVQRLDLAKVRSQANERRR